MVFVIMMGKYLKSLHAYYQIFVIYWMKIEPFCAACAQWLIEYGIMRLKMPTNCAQVVKYRLTVQQQLNLSMEQPHINTSSCSHIADTFMLNTGTLTSIPHTTHHTDIRTKNMHCKLRSTDDIPDHIKLEYSKHFILITTNWKLIESIYMLHELHTS